MSPLSNSQGLYQARSYSTSPASTGEPTIHNVFEPVTGTWQYIVADPSTHAAIIIDPVLDYEPATQAITTTAADALLSLARDKGYKIEKIIETHAHADHLTASSYLQHQIYRNQGYKPPIGIGKRIEQVQNLFGQRYRIGKEEYEHVFDHLFDDDESFTVGELTATALHLPGHTPDHLGYQIGGKYSISYPYLNFHLTNIFKTMYSAEILSSTQTSAQHAAISLAVTQRISSNQHADY